MWKCNGYMIPKTRNTVKKEFRCRRCGKSLTPAEAFYYVDGNNYAISCNAEYCIDCYRQTFPR